MPLLATLFLVLGLSCAHASESKAESCLRTKVWEGYSDGWAIRTMTSSTLDAGATRNYLVTFYPGKEYQIQTCGSDEIQDLDVLIYDLNGKIVKRDETTGREPMLTFSTDKIATYYVVVHARQLAAGKTSAGVAVAVTYR